MVSFPRWWLNARAGGDGTHLIPLLSTGRGARTSPSLATHAPLGDKSVFFGQNTRALRFGTTRGSLRSAASSVTRRYRPLAVWEQSKRENTDVPKWNCRSILWEDVECSRTTLLEIGYMHHRVTNTTVNSIYNVPPWKKPPHDASPQWKKLGK